MPTKLLAQQRFLKGIAMSAENGFVGKSTTKVILDPPAFSPPPEMRQGYLAKRNAALENLLDSVREGGWKTVYAEVNHVRGTGAMYGFPNMGAAAEALFKAIQKGDAKCRDYLNEYVETVRNSYV